jgi:hypothetical protein
LLQLCSFEEASPLDVRRLLRRSRLNELRLLLGELKLEGKLRLKLRIPPAPCRGRDETTLLDGRITRTAHGRLCRRERNVLWPADARAWAHVALAARVAFPTIMAARIFEALDAIRGHRRRARRRRPAPLHGLASDQDELELGSQRDPLNALRIRMEPVIVGVAAGTMKVEEDWRGVVDSVGDHDRDAARNVAVCQVHDRHGRWVLS